jgi:hypothetical protein
MQQWNLVFYNAQLKINRSTHTRQQIKAEEQWREEMRGESRRGGENRVGAENRRREL